MPNSGVKITVIKCAYNAEVAEKYANLDNPNLKQCPRHWEGQEFHTYWTQPEGFCDEAWKSIQHYVFALAHNGGSFFNGNYCRYPHMAVVCCSDAFKTVTFKLEAINEEHPEDGV